MNFITRYLMYPNQRAMFKQVRIINPVNIKIGNSLIKNPLSIRKIIKLISTKHPYKHEQCIIVCILIRFKNKLYLKDSFI